MNQQTLETILVALGNYRNLLNPDYLEDAKEIKRIDKALKEVAKLAGYPIVI